MQERPEPMSASVSGAAAPAAAVAESLSDPLADGAGDNDCYAEEVEEEDPPALDKEVEVEPCPEGKAAVGMEEVLAAEAASLEDEVANPSRNMRQEQLQKKAADAAAKEEKKGKRKGKRKRRWRRTRTAYQAGRSGAEAT